ncbi:hypothetical protein D3C78_948800 [compost metagenome]
MVFISHTPETVKEAVHLIEEAVETGDLDEAVIDAAVTKILAYKAQYASIEELDYEMVGCDVHRRANELMRTETICRIKGELQPIQAGDEQVLFIGSYSYRSDLASSSVNQDISFPQYMGEHFQAAYEIIDIDPSEEQINAALQQVQGYKHVVIGLFNARENKGQLTLVQKLLAADCKVTAITLGRPYDLSLIEGDFCGLTAFEYNLGAFKSLIPILDGELIPTASITIQL